MKSITIHETTPTLGILNSSYQNNGVRLNFHLHILIYKSRPDDHGSRRPDITQRLVQCFPNRLCIFLLSNKHPNTDHVFPATVQALYGVDDLFEDNEGLEISRVSMSDVSSPGVYRGRARNEDVWSFSDRPRIPESRFVGVRAGVGQRPQRGRLDLRLEKPCSIRRGCGICGYE